jgi:hypothetical protein
MEPSRPIKEREQVIAPNATVDREPAFVGKLRLMTIA